MFREASQTNYFQQKAEEGMNPYIGFVSFQHFNGEALYSDVVVKPENNMTETENLECYPIPDYVPQNGRAEGYYPDSTVAYIRILWKEFEPRQGEYHFEVMEAVLEQARQRGQTVVFRLLPHSTRACDDVPEWLKELISCPERPEGKRVKDSPTDPLFLELFGTVVRKIGERFDKDPTLDAVDISFPGAWGEGEERILALYPQEDLKKLVDIYTDVFRETRLMGQSLLPDLLRYASKTQPVGLRGDGMGHPEKLRVSYPERIKKVPDLWKKAPVSFEAFWWLGEWKRQGWDLDEIIERTLGWHLSTFNAKSVPIPWEWKDKVDYWISRMGYHYTIEFFRFPQKSCPGDVMELVLGIENTGVAPIYRQLPFCVRLKSEDSSEIFETDIDMRQWLPGKSQETWTVVLPEELPKGKYRIQIGVYGENVPMVYFGTDAARDERFYTVGELQVE